MQAEASLSVGAAGSGGDDGPGDRSPKRRRDATHGITVEEWRKFVDNMHYMTMCTCCGMLCLGFAVLRMNKRVNDMSDSVEKMNIDVYEPMASGDGRLPPIMQESKDWKALQDHVTALQKSVWPKRAYEIHSTIQRANSLPT